MIFVCIYLGSLGVFLAKFIEIERIFIAYETSKLETEGIREIKFQTKQIHDSV